LIIITTSSWTREWFEKMVIPYSRYSHKTFIYFDIGVGTFEQNFEELCELLLLQATKCQKVGLFATSDNGMEIYSAVVDELKETNPKIGQKLKGSHLENFMVATNKLACRSLISACSTLKFSSVTSTMETLPNVASVNFFKPLAGVASKGVFRYEENEIIKNPLEGTINEQAMNPILTRLCQKYDSLKPFLEDKVVGLVEEYVSVDDRKGTYSVDGYVYNKKIYFYGISENIYFEDRPEVFDCLVTPAQNINKTDRLAMYNLYMDVAQNMVNRGLDNQFLDVEMFLFKNGRAEVMEVNCRVFSNQIPVQTRCYGREHDTFALAFDLLLLDEQPKSCDILEKQEPHIGVKPQEIGVCVYRNGIPEIPRGKVISSENGRKFYYHPISAPDSSAHIYVLDANYSTPWTQVRDECDKFHAELKSKYSAQK